MGDKRNEGFRIGDSKEKSVINDQGNDGETTMNCIESGDTDIKESKPKRGAEKRGQQT